MAVQRKGFSAPDDSILIKTAEVIPVKEITTPKVQEIIEKMLKFAYPEQSDKKKPVLVGLAAPQVKISKRIILVDVKAEGHGVVGDLRVYINPEITWRSKEKNEWYEGCFSTDRVCGIVSRPTKIKIKAYTKDGKLVEEEYQGYTARIFQHEIDHLNGKEFTTHITDDNKLHWVEDGEFPKYRDKEAWRTWSNKCPRKRWEIIKGIKKQTTKVNKSEVIKKTREYVEKTLKGEGSGHDWWHILRVWNTAKTIGKKEKADIFVVELAALLHDIADWKFNDGDEMAGARVSRDWLEKLNVDWKTINHVCDIIATSSFKGAGVSSEMKTLEGKIVQDADRLDAIGAIGIGRTFAYGGHKGREMYNPTIKPELHKTAGAYKNNNSPTLNHFYEKLLLLKDLMNTKTAKQLAKGRHIYMEKFLNQFYKEWDGKI